MSNIDDFKEGKILLLQRALGGEEELLVTIQKVQYVHRSGYPVAKIVAVEAVSKPTRPKPKLRLVEVRASHGCFGCYYYNPRVRLSRQCKLNEYYNHSLRKPCHTGSPVHMNSRFFILKKVN